MCASRERGEGEGGGDRGESERGGVGGRRGGGEGEGEGEGGGGVRERSCNFTPIDTIQEECKGQIWREKQRGTLIARSGQL